MDYVKDYIEKKSKSVKKPLTQQALQYARLDRSGIIFDPNLPSIPEIKINLRAIKFYFYRYWGRKAVCKCTEPKTQPNCKYDPNNCKLNCLLIFEVEDGESEGVWLLKTSKLASLANIYPKREWKGKCLLKTLPITDYSDFRTIDLEPLEGQTPSIEGQEVTEETEEIEEIEVVELGTPITENTKKLLLTIPSKERLQLMKAYNKRYINELTEEEAQEIIKLYKEGKL